MKKILFPILLLVTMAGFASAQNTKIYKEQGGAKEVILSGGELEVRTGGLIELQQGSTLTVQSGATINIPTAPTFSDLTVTYGVGATTGVFSGAVTAASIAAPAHTGATIALTGAADFNGAVTMGADGTVSTITAAGAAAFHTSVTAPAVTGSTSVSGAKVVVTGGPLQLYSRTQAQIEAFTPSAVGEVYYCNDCTVTAVVVSSAPAVMSWVSVVDPTTAMD